MKKLLDITDRKTRLLQQVLTIAWGLLAALGFGMVLDPTPVLPPPVAASILGSALVLLAVTAGIKQRWEIDYRGHRIRFENSPVTAERLFLDEGLVARGGFGRKMELRAPIRVGEGAGEEIVALVDAGFREFRLRIFVETKELDSTHTAVLVTPAPAVALSQAYAAALEDLRPVTQSAMLGKILLAKYILEFIASLIGIIGAVIVLATWLL